MGRFTSRFQSLKLIALVGGIGLFATTRPARAEKQVDFNKDIKPIFHESCIKCHSLDNPKKKAASKFRLDNRADALKGGDSAGDKDIIPGNAKQSVLYKLLLGPVTVDGDDIDPMPKHKKGHKFKPLPAKQIELIKEWIDQGAKWSD